MRLNFSVNCVGKCLKQFGESPCFVYNIEVPVMTWYHVIDYLHLGNRTLDVISFFLINQYILRSTVERSLGVCAMNERRNNKVGTNCLIITTGKYQSLQQTNGRKQGWSALQIHVYVGLIVAVTYSSRSLRFVWSLYMCYWQHYVLKYMRYSY